MSVIDSKDLSKVKAAWDVTAERIIARRGGKGTVKALYDEYMASVPEGTGNVHQFAAQYGVEAVMWSDLPEPAATEPAKK